MDGLCRASGANCPPQSPAVVTCPACGRQTPTLEGEPRTLAPHPAPEEQAP